MSLSLSPPPQIHLSPPPTLLHNHPISDKLQEMLASDASPTAMSPARLSFSYDLRCQSDVVSPHLPTTADFDFCVRKSCGQDSSSADELFSDGKILPAEIKKNTHKPKSTNHPALPPAAISEIEISSDETEEKEKQSSHGNGKSFWRFKRSSSLNCGSGYGPSLCPLPLLSRSHSTGSSGSSKRTHKPPSSTSGNYQKPPLKKSYGGQQNGVRVNPVLHIPVVNIFGIGSIFTGSHGRDKSKIVKK